MVPLPLHSKGPFVFSGNTSTVATPGTQKAKFDLKASLSRPLTYKPHAGTRPGFILPGWSGERWDTATHVFVFLKVNWNRSETLKRTQQQTSPWFPSARIRKTTSSIKQKPGLFDTEADVERRPRTGSLTGCVCSGRTGELNRRRTGSRRRRACSERGEASSWCEHVAAACCPV